MSLAAGWRPPRVRRLAGGLTVGLVERRQSPIVSTALCYRVGSAAEPAELAGMAHFLEHMMFKGSAGYGPGEVDRLTQRLGGANNAYTGHDATVYEFSFAGGGWLEAVSIEADRMAGLRLEPGSLDAEREVILEELAMIEDDPWESLELAVLAEVYRSHPYARPVLGRTESLRRIGRDELAAFHRLNYQPAGAVLVIAGDVGEEAFDAVEERFSGLAAAPGAGPPAPGGGHEPLPARSPGRVELRRGEMARLLLALPAPAAGRPGYAELRVVLTILAGGRSSRLHRQLVEGRQLCSSVGAHIDETVGPGVAMLACELLPGASEAAAEAVLLDELGRMADGGPTVAEIARARRQLLADWIFSRETVAQEALSTATAIALFDPEHDLRHLERIERCTPRELAAAASSYLDAAGLVLGWSRPEAGR